MKSLCLFVLLAPFLHASPAIESIAGKKTVFLGDSITQAGTYVSFTSYYLQRFHPEKDFDIYPLGLGSETVSGLSEEGHAGGRFPRPSLFERLDRVLAKVKPEIVFANRRLMTPLILSAAWIFFLKTSSIGYQSKAKWSGVQPFVLGADAAAATSAPCRSKVDATPNIP